MAEDEPVRSEHILAGVVECSNPGFTHYLTFLCGFFIEVRITNEMVEDFKKNLGTHYYLSEEEDGSLTIYSVDSGRE